jgi:hypothetical protein
MTDMNTPRIRVFGTGIMLAMVLAPFAGFAQEPANADDELLPTVDTSAVETSPKPGRVRQQEMDALQPSVNSPILPEDIKRRTTGNQVMDSMELGRTEITGNQELPKVLYIVPWQKSDPGELMGKPVNTLIDEVLAPIDREEFIRQVNYYDDLYGDEDE